MKILFTTFFISFSILLCAQERATPLAAKRIADTLTDYKGFFIADKKPLANSTVNLLNSEGNVYQTTKTDVNGGFKFVGVSAEKELILGLDEKETKKFKEIILLDTAGVKVH